MKTYQIGFVIEQALGHVTHTQNLQANVPKDPAVRAHWALPVWQKNGLGSKLPVYKSNWTVQAGLQARRALAGLRGQVKLDALFFHTQVTAVLSPDWLRRVPSVVSLDATPLQYDRLGQFYAHEAGPAWLEGIKYRLNHACFQRARHLVTWSEWAKQGLVTEYGVPADKVTVIPPGVNSREWERPAARRPHKNTAKILFVGGDLERKGGLLLLQAFRNLRQQGAIAINGNGTAVDVELHLVTKTNVPAEANLFVYNDMQANSPALKQLYYDCDIFCLPTYGDCLPMVLSEAGAAGLPAVTTCVAAIPEIVQDGVTGFLVPPGDVAALTAALHGLIANPELRIRQGQQAVERVRQKFDAEENALRLLELLKGVAEKRI
jgi:glycosyltransferase involved in cell wall biosynthesis